MTAATPWGWYSGEDRIGGDTGLCVLADANKKPILSCRWPGIPTGENRRLIAAAPALLAALKVARTYLQGKAVVFMDSHPEVLRAEVLMLFDAVILAAEPEEKP